MDKSQIPFGPLKNCFVYAYDDTQNEMVVLDAKIFWWPIDPEYFDDEGPIFVNALVEDTVFKIYYKNIVKITDRNCNKITRFDITL